MFNSRPIPRDLVNGREALDHIDNFEVLKELQWNSTVAAWVLKVHIKADVAFNDLVPFSSEWFIVIAHEYPFGKIEFFPAKKNSLKTTFPHQALNIETPTELWRLGKICLGDRLSSLGDTFFSFEPYGKGERLRWNVERAQRWLEKASWNQLLETGDYFELPDFAPGSHTFTAFVETPASLVEWQNSGKYQGLFRYYAMKSPERRYVVKEFLTSSKSRNIIERPHFGDYIKKLSVAEYVGVWIRLERMPIVPAWQPPTTWQELRKCMGYQDRDLDRTIETLYSTRTKREKIGTLMLLGFPIPEKIGGELQNLHWQTALLPGLSFIDSDVQGFRPGINAARLDNRRQLAEKKRIVWEKTDNWAPSQIRSRNGTILTELIQKKIVLIGAGAVGSAIGEMLVRNGLDRLTIWDGDKVAAGNLVRHTLDLSDVSTNKAVALAKKLNRLSPWAKIEAVDSDVTEDLLPRLADFDLVIDCTASQAMLAVLATNEFPKEVQFVSFSISFGAKRLYFFSSISRRFPFDRFREMVHPWFALDRDENKNAEAPQEGVGCWHPVFPARSDDIWLLASTGFKLLVDTLESRAEFLKVFEQQIDQGFAGIKEAQLNVPK